MSKEQLTISCEVQKHLYDDGFERENKKTVGEFSFHFNAVIAGVSFASMSFYGDEDYYQAHKKRIEDATKNSEITFKFIGEDDE